MGDKYLIRFTTGSKSTKVQGTVKYLSEYFSEEIRCGKANEKGNKKVNANPENIDELVECLNNAAYNKSIKDHSPVTTYETLEIPERRPGTKGIYFPQWKA